ncbi:hypothetical protein FRACYDRAFT_250116 [Fragilariopsis cylindrus CCMP1102]|uniref:Uncharacterized protein n=1 Tax=Fragilariopsis cylindrus CCMP1102 TaxID=635003 RepID=A0A1E7ERY1_9STRA|nr:hypothetical protein FRACYDRAFT_250116 [Fragilariopsis cylindrus CCMP1102]|eukprot:OEU08323.1 hypothetical protein FRACYDRAFT_250116 [Fragilariopsis cylindrus CCMP1102]
MNQIASKAKSTVKSIVKVPQQIGRTILSVPDNLLKQKQQQQQKQQRKQNKNELETDDPELFFIGDTNNKRNTSKHATLCTTIIEDQQVREVVRESQLQCLQEIMDHLQLYLFENNSTETSSYEGWIASLHPDNVKDNTNNNNNSSTSNNISSGGGGGGGGGGVREIIIDHRFYMKDSHHRQLWNEYMEKLECRESSVEGNKRSIEPTHTVRSLLSEQPTNNDMAGMGSSWFFPL